MEYTATDAGRLDMFLAAQSGMSRSQAADCIRRGCVTVNGRLLYKPAQLTEPGMLVAVDPEGLPVSETHVEKVNLHLEILYEDETCLVISKPAGTAVHPAPGLPRTEHTVLHGAAWLFAERGIPFDASHVLVHRLDKDTTGALLLAKSPRAHKELQAQFQERTVQKFYLALVAGVPSPATALIDAAVGRSTSNRTKMSVLGASGTREARTTYRTLAVQGPVALLSCELHTGRTHQIRVHLHAIGHPILGDTTYSSAQSERLNEEFGVKRICLHAWRLKFVSVQTGKEVLVSVDPPAVFQESLRSCEISWPLTVGS